MSTHRLETKRLLLCRWESADWLAFKPIATDPLVMKYISDGKPWPDEKIAEFVDRQIRQLGKHGFCLWKLLLRENQRPLGFCGLQPLDDLPGVEIGWWLASDQWAKDWPRRRLAVRWRTDSLG